MLLEPCLNSFFLKNRVTSSLQSIHSTLRVKSGVVPGVTDPIFPVYAAYNILTLLGKFPLFMFCFRKSAKEDMVKSLKDKDDEDKEKAFKNRIT